MAAKSKNSGKNHRWQGSGNSLRRKTATALKEGKRNLLKNIPAPIRKDKVRMAKKRLASGFYTSSQLNALIAERIIQDFKNFGNT